MDPKNTLNITVLADGRVKTIIVTTDGVKRMEIHRQGLSDASVLHRIMDKKFYQGFHARWYIYFEQTNRMFSDDSFETAVQEAQQYIFNRDNNWYC